MEVLTYTVPPEEDGVCVRHILKARLHFSAHAVARLTRVEGGITVNGQPIEGQIIPLPDAPGAHLRVEVQQGRG